MATIIHASLPLDEFALTTTLGTCPSATVECERLVETPTNTVLPLVWVRETMPGAFEAALEQDETVGSYTRLASTETETLYEMDWSANIDFVLRLFTIEGAVILDTQGSAAGWELRVLFPTREDVGATTEFCESHGLSPTIHTIRDLDDEDASQGSIRANLTATQHEALTAAYTNGYFEVPRTVDLEAVATDLDISHQALSERLRRGHKALIGETLLGGEGAPAAATSAASAAARDDGEAPPGDE